MNSRTTELQLLDPQVETTTTNVGQSHADSDDTPLIVGYCRVKSSAPLTDDAPYAHQQRAIIRACDERLGQDAYRIIWVLETTTASQHDDEDKLIDHEPGRYGPKIIAELVKSRPVSFLAVERLCRLTRSAILYFIMEEDLLRPNGIELIVAAQTASTEPLDWIERLVTCCE